MNFGSQLGYVFVRPTFGDITSESELCHHRYAAFPYKHVSTGKVPMYKQTIQRKFLINENLINSFICIRAPEKMTLSVPESVEREILKDQQVQRITLWFPWSRSQDAFITCFMKGDIYYLNFSEWLTRRGYIEGNPLVFGKIKFISQERRQESMVVPYLFAFFPSPESMLFLRQNFILAIEKPENIYMRGKGNRNCQSTL